MAATRSSLARAAVVAVGAALAAAACTERVPLPTVGAGAGGRPGGRGDAGSGDRAPDAKCQEYFESVPVRVHHPEVVISFDRSFSMTRAYGASSRIQVARQALLAAVRSHEERLEIGYQEFPGRVSCEPVGCCASRVLVPPQLNGYAALEAQLRCDPADRGCFESPMESPSADAISRLRRFFDVDADPRAERFVLLVTDGAPSCEVGACDKMVEETSRLWSEQGVKTAVLTLGDEVKTSPCLDMVAAAGQMARQGMPSYHWAADEAQFKQQVQDVVSQMTTRLCRVTLRNVPPSTDRLSVTLNDVPVPRDPSGKDGWSFDPPRSLTLRLHGSWCEKLRASTAPARDIKVLLACQQCGSTVTCD